MANEALKRFVVIHFNVDNSVAALPASWLEDNNTKCRWPSKPPKNFEKYLKEADSKPGPEWDLWDCQVVKSYSKWQ